MSVFSWKEKKKKSESGKKKQTGQSKEEGNLKRSTEKTGNKSIEQLSQQGRARQQQQQAEGIDDYIPPFFE